MLKQKNPIKILNVGFTSENVNNFNCLLTVDKDLIRQQKG